MTTPTQQTTEVDRLRGIAARLLASLQDLAGATHDPGVEALCAIYEARQFFKGSPEPPADLVERAADAIAEDLGHYADWDTPDGPCCDNTMGCGGHKPVKGCEQCADPGWPCGYARNIARLVLNEIAPCEQPDIRLCCPCGQQTVCTCGRSAGA